MSDKLDHFTSRAKRAMILAQEEAIRLRYDTIGPEHFLLGLIRLNDDSIIQTLRALGVEPGQVIRTVERSVAYDVVPIMRKPTLSPPAKEVVVLAVKEASAMAQTYIGVEHLLLGLVRTEDPTAVGILRALGITEERVRPPIERILQKAQTRDAQSQQAQTSGRESRRRLGMGSISSDLIAMAGAGELDPLIGRQQELERMIQILGRRTKRNVLLIGEHGVGKHALIRGLAQRINEGEVPAGLLNQSLYEMDMVGTGVNVVYRMLMLERLQEELEQDIATGALLFINKMHIWVDAAGTNVQVAKLLRQTIDQANLQVIGATTPEQYNKVIGLEGERDWDFQSIWLEEPSAEDAVEILRGIKNGYEQHHHVVFTEEALQTAVQMAVRHVPDRFLPDKAIDLIDETGSRVQMHKAKEAYVIYRELQQVVTEKAEAIEAEQTEQVFRLRQREVELTAKLEQVDASQPEVTLDDVAEVVSQWTGIAANRLIAEERARQAENEPPATQE